MHTFYGFTKSTPLDRCYRFSRSRVLLPVDEGAAVYRFRDAQPLRPAYCGVVIRGRLCRPGELPALRLPARGLPRCASRIDAMSTHRRTRPMRSEVSAHAALSAALQRPTWATPAKRMPRQQGRPAGGIRGALSALLRKLFP